MTTIKTNSKKEFEATIKKYRENGYNLITLGNKIAEVEKNNKVVVIER